MSDNPDAIIRECGEKLDSKKFQQEQLEILQHCMTCNPCAEKMRYIGHLTTEIKGHAMEALK